MPENIRSQLEGLMFCTCASSFLPQIHDHIFQMEKESTLLSAPYQKYCHCFPLLHSVKGMSRWSVDCLSSSSDQERKNFVCCDIFSMKMLRSAFLENLATRGRNKYKRWLMDFNEMRRAQSECLRCNPCRLGEELSCLNKKGWGGAQIHRMDLQD